MIKIESTRHQYEYFQPWSRRTASNNKFGVVVHDQRIITTADYLSTKRSFEFKRADVFWYKPSFSGLIIMPTLRC